MELGNREKRILAQELYDEEHDRLKEEGLIPDFLLFGQPLPRMDKTKKVLTLLLTTECNAGCSYCYAGNYGKKQMTIETARTAIDAAFKDFSGEINVIFFGAGEPTTEIGLIEAILRYLEENYRGRYAADLMTNGMFSESAYATVQKMDSICISHDGLPEFQDKMRPLKGGRGSSDLVLKNIKYLIGRKPVSIRTTITGLSIGRLREIIDYFLSLGVKNVSLSPFFSTSRSESNNVLAVDEKEFVDNFLEAKRYGEEKGIKVSSEYLLIIPKASFCGFEQPMPTVTPGGFLSACWEWCETGEGRKYVYGKAGGETNPTYEKIKERTPENLQKCNQCFLRFTCAGGCAARHYEKTGNLMRLDDERCELMRYAVKKYLLQTIREYKNETENN